MAKGHSRLQEVAIRRGADLSGFFRSDSGARDQEDKRPALIIQNEVGNRHSLLTIVAAITSTISAVPFPVEVVVAPTKNTGLTAKSAIRLDQIRTVDRQRLIKRLGMADVAIMPRVDEALEHQRRPRRAYRLRTGSLP